jgi:DnaK suppressor protein
MNSKDLSKLKKKLLEQKSDLQLQEKEYKEASSTVELDQTRVGRISRMDAMQGQQMALESARRRQQQIKKIDGALQRIEIKEYGHCFVCGKTISLPRLSANPTSTRCVDCVE